MYIERCETFKKHFKEIVKIKYKKTAKTKWKKIITNLLTKRF